MDNRKVKMFRCQIDPMVGPIPRNAFTPEQMGMEAELRLPVGVWVKVLATKREHIVPFANIQSIELEKEVVTETTTTTKARGKQASLAV